MPEPFFLAVTRTPSIGPPAPVTCPESPGSALAATAPTLAATSATARLAAVDNNTCFTRIMITPRYVLSWYAFSGERPKQPDLILSCPPAGNSGWSEFASYASSSVPLGILYVEILQVRRALALLGRHEEPVGAEHVV